MTLARVFEELVGPDTPVEFVAYDGSRAGRQGAAIRFEVRSPYAVSYLVHSPGSLGLARAYISGYLDVSGDMYTALSTMTQALSDVTVSDKIKVLREVLKDPLLRAAVSRRLDPPPQEAPFSRVPSWLRHSKRRDAKAISHHYDVSNTFYEWVLGPSMAYTCACFPKEDSTLEEAQYFKHDLVAKKLGLKPGMRLLDVGCGWGGMVMHAAKEYGVKALGVTLSKQQAEWAQKAIADRGLSELAEVRHLDYRDVTETGFDRVSSIGLTEHIGKKNLPAYFSFLYGKLKPGGRLLNHTITRPDNIAPPIKQGGFINRYVFPDGELEGPGYIQSQMNDAGFEIRHQENLREHYARTLAGWCRNLDEHWDEAVAEVGEGTARVWKVYMAGCQIGFEQNWIQLHQTLGVKLDDRGDAHMPLRPDWGS
ncbi:class I SAM-dependent methyltransferase [Actinomadura sp. SCN-SB]|uniref:class I SAM-dependent methyltransferase n=1 Tax=Actinomadura sp. SCN-SB TaxID=3373092 RepID=UPI0037529964